MEAKCFGAMPRFVVPTGLKMTQEENKKITEKVIESPECFLFFCPILRPQAEFKGLVVSKDHKLSEKLCQLVPARCAKKKCWKTNGPDVWLRCGHMMTHDHLNMAT